MYYNKSEYARTVSIVLNYQSTTFKFKTFRIFGENDEEKVIFNETVKWTSVDLVGGVLIFPFELFRQINGYRHGLNLCTTNSGLYM